MAPRLNRKRVFAARLLASLDPDADHLQLPL
jgi:hypothetical protein